LRSLGPLGTLRSLSSGLSFWAYRSSRSGRSSDLSCGLDRAVRELHPDRADADHPCDVEPPLRIRYTDADEASGVVDEELLADRIEHPDGRDA